MLEQFCVRNVSVMKKCMKENSMYVVGRHVARSKNLWGRVTNYVHITWGQKSGGRAVRAGPKSGGRTSPCLPPSDMHE
jgi:hypothetical protein